MKLELTIFSAIAVFFIQCADIFNEKPDIDEITLFEPNNKQIYATGFIIHWSKVTSENFFAYKVYLDTAPNISENSILIHTELFKADTSFLVKGLEPTRTYYAKVFVYSSSSSRASNEISATTTPCSSGVFTGQEEDSMVLIPAGSYRDYDSLVASVVRDFYMDMAEVTEAQWAFVMGNSPDSSQKPKTDISWYEIILYCNKKSRLTQRDTCYTYTQIVFDDYYKIANISNVQCDFDADGYRLPTEDEWEYAFRAGTHTDYYWGKNYGMIITQSGDTIEYPSTIEDSLEISSHAWWKYDQIDSSQIVAKKEPHNWKLYDMAGNAAELVWDWSSPRLPEDRIGYSGPETGTKKINRGGCFQNGAYEITAFCRCVMEPDKKNLKTGFRTVRTKTY